MTKDHEIADQPSKAVGKEPECELTEAELHLVSGGGIGVANLEKLEGMTLGGPAHSKPIVLENVVEVFERGNR